LLLWNGTVVSGGVHEQLLGWDRAPGACAIAHDINPASSWGLLAAQQAKIQEATWQAPQCLRKISACASNSSSIAGEVQAIQE
jgi:hypothetical protein